jgi:dipeptide transport system ATP-binding protein
MSALLEVNNISKSYQLPSRLLGTTTECILSDISFELEAGKILAVVGESGSGKSTLARQVVKLEQPDSGEMFLDGKAYASVPDLHQRVRMIFQNPAASLNPRKRVYQLLEEPLKNLRNLSSSERGVLIYQCLEHVGLDKDQALRYPHMLSGGQRQRIAIARAIILSPQVIVADEAVSALDVSVQAQILNLIMDLRDDMGMSWLFITHDISVVNVIADTVLVLYAGRVMETGPVKQVLESPLHPYTRKLLQSVPCVDSTGNELVTVDVNPASDDEVPKGPACAYLARCPIADKHCAECIPPMMNLDKHQVACLKAVEST